MSNSAKFYGRSIQVEHFFFFSDLIMKISRRTYKESVETVEIIVFCILLYYSNKYLQFPFLFLFFQFFSHQKNNLSSPPR